MHLNKYEVKFEHNAVVTVYAWSETEARILAMAKRIEDGLTYFVVKVTRIKNEK